MTMKKKALVPPAPTDPILTEAEPPSAEAAAIAPDAIAPDVAAVSINADDAPKPESVAPEGAGDAPDPASVSPDAEEKAAETPDPNPDADAPVRWLELKTSMAGVRIAYARGDKAPICDKPGPNGEPSEAQRLIDAGFAIPTTPA